MKLFWHAIVRNEHARIERCMQTLVGHIDGCIILDTGSADDTIELIEKFMKKHGLYCEIGHGQFRTWDQARNDALTLARASPRWWDHLLLVDADMALVVTDPAWKAAIGDAPSYEIEQHGGNLVYSNSRVLNRSATGVYRGVTHEYLDVPTGGILKGAHFVDYADGANRDGKALRDAALLEKGLEKEPQNGRYWFYLGNSYKEAGLFEAAIAAYKNAVKYGTWDEEIWYARFSLAKCYLELDDRGSFYRELLDAYNFRPSRAEALYELAKHFRIRGENHTSLLFSEMGLTKLKSGDRLFVEEYPTRVGFKEEFAICGFYDPARRKRGRAFNNELAILMDGDATSRAVARNNMFFYLETLKEFCPSAKFEEIEFTPPEGYVGMNPSISQAGEILVRCVNYTITPWGSYDIRGPNGSVNRENPIHTRNFIRTTPGGPWREVIPPEYTPKYNLVRGPEDMRIFNWRGKLWSLSNFRDRCSNGACQQHLAGLKLFGGGNTFHMVELTHVEPQDFTPSYSEKNWMPWVYDGRLQFVHRLGRVLGEFGHTVLDFKSNIDVERLSGGGSVVPIGPGPNQWLVIVHEAQQYPGKEGVRYYYHRFALLGYDGTPMALSRPFVFHDKQIEFAAGLRNSNGVVTVTYGVRDLTPWLVKIPEKEVMGLFA